MTSSPAAPADYWSVLGLEPGADASNLKRAFRAQARRWHPDLNGNDPLAEERFKLVNEAYAVLSDPRRRQAWEAGMPADGSGRESQDPFASGFPDFEAYLEVLFGERRRPRRAAEPEWQEPEPEPEPPAPPPPSGLWIGNRRTAPATTGAGFQRPGEPGGAHAGAGVAGGAAGAGAG